MSDAVAPGTADIWWLGQGSFVFEGPTSGPLVVDPYLSEACGAAGFAYRMPPIPIAPDDLKVSAIFLTHDHLDHTDPETLIPLCAANPTAPIFGPPESVAHLAQLGISGERVHSVARGEKISIPGATVYAVNALHTDDSVGFIFAFEDGPLLYHTADTEFYEGIGEEAERLGVDLLSICINGRLGNMGISDAVRVTEIVHPREVLPMHWGMFDINTADPQEFVAVLKDAGIASKPIVLPPDGSEHYTLVAGKAD